MAKGKLTGGSVANQSKAEVISLPEARTPRTVKTAELIEHINAQLGAQAIPVLYQNLVLAERTRQYQLDAEQRGGAVEILHTLLGIELKVGHRRLLCPDLATARYLAVFARIGIDLIAIPYDITQISRIADELESSWYRMMLLVEHLTVERSERLRAKVRRSLIEQCRTSVKELGAGTRIPKFNQNTKQRKPRV